MRQDIKYKIMPIGSQGVWKRGSLKDLVLDIPYFIRREDDSILPSLEDLNHALAQGRRDAGMSGGCDWKPFQVSQEEYDELVLELITDPGSNLKQP